MASGQTDGNRSYILYESYNNYSFVKKKIMLKIIKDKTRSQLSLWQTMQAHIKREVLSCPRHAATHSSLTLHQIRFPLEQNLFPQKLDSEYKRGELFMGMLYFLLPSAHINMRCSLSFAIFICIHQNSPLIVNSKYTSCERFWLRITICRLVYLLRIRLFILIFIDEICNYKWLSLRFTD